MTFLRKSVAQDKILIVQENMHLTLRKHLRSQKQLLHSYTSRGRTQE